MQRDSLYVPIRHSAPPAAQASHLLKYDSTLGTFNANVKIVDDNTLSVDGKNIRIVSSRDPLQLPWKEMGIDIVIEGTGVFVDSKGAGKHLEVGCPSLPSMAVRR